MWPESKSSFERKFEMSMKYLTSHAWLGSADSGLSAAPRLPEQALPLPRPESSPQQQDQQPWAWLVSWCSSQVLAVSPSTYSGLRFPSFCSQNKQKTKLSLAHWALTLLGTLQSVVPTFRGWHRWSAKGQHRPATLSASLSTAAHAEQCLEPASLLSLPASTDGEKCTLILNNG